MPVDTAIYLSSLIAEPGLTFYLYCRRYRGFRDDQGDYTPDHWKILALKLCFVIIFEVR